MVSEHVPLKLGGLLSLEKTHHEVFVKRNYLSTMIGSASCQWQPLPLCLVHLSPPPLVLPSNSIYTWENLAGSTAESFTAHL